MPQHEAAELIAGAGAMAVTLDAAQADRLLAYLDLLERWNRAYNLTSVRERHAMRVQHLLDCLAVLPGLSRELPAGGRLLDVGSGGGLPGVVIAILTDNIEVICVDAVGKKAAFVRQVAGVLALPRLAAIHSRVEALLGPPFDVITSRAFASLPDFVELTARLLAGDGKWMAMKSRSPTEEISHLPASIDVFHVEPLQVPGLHAERCLVWMRQKLRYPPAIP